MEWLENRRKRKIEERDRETRQRESNDSIDLAVSINDASRILEELHIEGFANYQRGDIICEKSSGWGGSPFGWRDENDPSKYIHVNLFYGPEKEYIMQISEGKKEVKIGPATSEDVITQFQKFLYAKE